MILVLVAQLSKNKSLILVLLTFILATNYAYYYYFLFLKKRIYDLGTIKSFGFENFFLELLLDHGKVLEYANDELTMSKQNVLKGAVE